jgi:hypothetical protein
MGNATAHKKQIETQNWKHFKSMCVDYMYIYILPAPGNPAVTHTLLLYADTYKNNKIQTPLCYYLRVNNWMPNPTNMPVCYWHDFWWELKNADNKIIGSQFDLDPILGILTSSAIFLNWFDYFHLSGY